MICERLGIDEATIECVENLIYLHLIMFRYSERTDFTDDRVVESFGRLVENPERLANSILIARAEAETAFGDPSVYLEKYLPNPRHVEVQLLGDKVGNVVHLGERDCSIQRRQSTLDAWHARNPAVDEHVLGLHGGRP